MGAGLLLSRIGDSTVDNTAAETTTFSDTVPAGTPGTDELLIVRSISDIRNDSGSAATSRQRWSYGGTLLFDHTTISLADAAATDRYADITTIFLAGENSVTAQRSMMDHKQSGAITLNPGTYVGGNDHNNSIKSSAVDSASAQTLAKTITLSAANTELEYRDRGVWVERWNTDTEPDGTSGSRLLLLDGTENTLTGSTTSTKIATLTVPGGTLSTGNLLLFEICMDALNTSGSTAQWWTDIFFGGQHVFDGVSGVANASHADRRGFPLQVWIAGHGATNDQVCAMVGQSFAGFTSSGTGVVASATGQANNSVSFTTVDSTVNQDLEIWIDFNVTSASVEVRYLSAMVAVIKA